MNEAECHHCATRGLHIRHGDNQTNGLTHVEGDVFACPACGACYQRALGGTLFSGYTFTRLAHADWVKDALAEAVREPAPSPAYRCPGCGAKTAGAANAVITCAQCGKDFKPLAG